MRASRKPGIAAFVISILVAAQSCGRDAPLVLTEQDAGSTVQLRVGERVDVVLPGNPTTGYVWQRAAGDATILQQEGEAEFEPRTQAIGSGGNVTLRFVAKQAGETDLRLDYSRPFEPDTLPADRFGVQVRVLQ